MGRRLGFGPAIASFDVAGRGTPWALRCRPPTRLELPVLSHNKASPPRIRPRHCILRRRRPLHARSSASPAAARPELCFVGRPNIPSCSLYCCCPARQTTAACRCPFLTPVPQFFLFCTFIQQNVCLIVVWSSETKLNMPSLLRQPTAIHSLCVPMHAATVSL